MTSPRDRVWLLAVAAEKRLTNLPVLGPLLSGPCDRFFAKRFVTDLQALHDVLEGSEMAQRYWVWAGLLLGWVREGGPIPHDRDADLGLLDDDLERLLATVPALRRAGFRPLMQYRNNAGHLSELTFRKHGAKFEFFVFSRHGDACRSYTFGYPPDHLVEVEFEVPAQDYVEFELVGRRWLCHTDYERELELMYGDWRTPRRQWNYLTDDRSIVTSRKWNNIDTSWSDT